MYFAWGRSSYPTWVLLGWERGINIHSGGTWKPTIIHDSVNPLGVSTINNYMYVNV